MNSDYIILIKVVAGIIIIVIAVSFLPSPDEDN